MIRLLLHKKRNALVIFLFLSLFSFLPMYGQNHPWELHGDLKVEGRYLIHEDGTPFFYLGDTNWEFLVRARRDDAKRLIQNRAQKGFSVMQAVISGAFIKSEGSDGSGLQKPNVYRDFPFIDGDVTKPLITPGSDPNDSIQYDFWDHVDYIVKEAESNGIYIGLLMSWHLLYDLGVVNKENARAYGKWIGKRYAEAPNIIWILGGDTRGDTGEGEIVFDEMAAGIKEGDTGQHLMTFHARGSFGSADWFHDRSWLDYNTIQSGHSAYDRPNYERITKDYTLKPAKPCMDSEPRYEDHSVNWNPDNGWFNDFDVRQAAYWSLFAGAHGHTYGTRGVWQMYEPGRDKRGPLNYYWFDAMDLAGGWDMKHVKDLMLSRPFLSRVPDQTILKETYSGADHIQATRGDGYAFIYIPTGKNVTVNLSWVKQGESLTVWWYNPRDGITYNEKGNVTHRPFKQALKPGSTATFDPPGSPQRGNDWVLILDYSSKSYPEPGTGYTQPTLNK